MFRGAKNHNLQYELLKLGDYSLKCKTFVSSQFSHFDGHFDQKAILPAVSQLSIVADALSCLTQENIRFTSFSKCKFLAPILPNTEIVITVQINPEKKSGTWFLQTNDVSLSKGLFSYKEIK